MRNRSPRRHKERVEERFIKPHDAPRPRPTSPISKDRLGEILDQVLSDEEAQALLTRLVEQMGPGEELDKQQAERILHWAKVVRFDQLMLEMVMEGRFFVTAPTDDPKDITFRTINPPHDPSQDIG